MPRRSPLTASERASLLAFPTADEDLIRHYTLGEPDTSVVRQHRGDQNRLGFTVQLCALRYPGCPLMSSDTTVPDALLSFVAGQLHLVPDVWSLYAQRIEIRREHLRELQAYLGLTVFGVSHFRHFVRDLTGLAQETDKGIVLATALVEALRQRKVIVPVVEVVERVCAEALARGTRKVYGALTGPLSSEHRTRLDSLLSPREKTSISALSWLRQPSGVPNAKHVLAHIERLSVVREVGLPDALERSVHQNRLLKLAREGGQMTAQHLRDLEETRRHATLAAVVLETRATLIDETIDMLDRLLGALFNRAKRHHAERFQRSGKAINHQVRLYSRIGRALLEAKQSGADPFAAIETIVSWKVFTESITEAERLALPADFDYLPLLNEGYTQIHRCASAVLEALELTAAPAASDILDGVETLRDMHRRQARRVPDDAPTGFVRRRWEGVVQTENGMDRRFYELCVLSELKNALRSGDIWVKGSRQFKDFEEYLLAPARFADQREQGALGLAVESDADRFKITELLLEVDGWIGFSRHFTHLKTNQPAQDRSLLLTAVLADGINLGLVKMAESCPGITYSKLSWLQAWHVRDETYSAALAEVVNAQFRHPFAAYWGDGTTSSSDGQRFRAGGTGEAMGQVNARYGSEPGALFYTHISDQYAPFHTQVVNATVRDATYVLDGLLHHESDLRIEEHYTDTAGFTDHVFALMHLLGFRFAPRIRDLADKRLYISGEPIAYPTLSGLIGGMVDAKRIRAHWDEILRLSASIRQGTTTASLMLRKLGSYPRQNGLAVALRDLGRIERTLFTLEWLQDVELRRRVQVGLNKGEAKNALARAVFFNRLGELRDRSFENQRYRASGLNLVVASIVLWNTVYLGRAIKALRESGQHVDDSLLQHLSPLRWEHINLTGDYVWEQSQPLQLGQFRPLRSPANP
ncbi:MAG TPA: Tn3 family transposase [Armatimonadota bacterium]|jgi:TnpA family transposase